MTTLMGGTAENKVLIMQSAIEGMKIELGALIAEAVVPMIKGITKLAGKFSNLSEGTKKFIIVFGGMAAAIGPILLGFAALLSIVSPIGIAIAVVVSGIAALTAATWESQSAIEAENDALNILATRAMSANTGTEKRKTLIEELNTKYPSFLKNLEDESISNKGIQTALEGANTAFTAKLKLQGESKKLQKLQNAQSEAGSRLIDSEGEAILELNDLYEDSGKTMGSYHSTQEKLARALEDMEGGYHRLDSKTRVWLGTLGDKRVDGSRGNIVDLNQEVSSNQKAFDDAKKAVEEYMAALGQATPTVGEGTDSIVTKTVIVKVKPIDPPSGGWFDLSEAELSEPFNELQGFADQFGGVSVDVELNLPTKKIETMGEKISSSMEGMAGKVLKFTDTWGAGIEQVGAIFSQVYKNKGIAIDNDHNKQMVAIEASSMSEEQKETAMQTLNKETAKKKLDLKRKQAKVDKAMAIFNIINATAVAIMQAGNPFAAVAMGILGAVQIGVVQSQPVPAFAQGGLVTGATMGLVGEGRGTSMSNPEVIAPLDKLKSMLGDSGGGGVVIPDVRITGDDLLIVFDRASRRKERR
jgi:hypothetical protein